MKKQDETALIRGENLSKCFGGVTALRDTNIEIEKGKITAIIGGSGSGKTTILRLLSGLEKPTCGQVWVGDDNINEISDKRLYEIRKGMGMLFQYSALLNSLNVYENVSFPLNEHTKLSHEAIAKIVAKKLEDVGLRGFEEVMPGELSGGMAKRVAFARAVAMNPKIIFFDEPTSGLDPISAGVITTLIKDTVKAHNMTSIVVTHDVEAGLSIADKVILMWQGEIIVRGTAEEMRNSDDERVRQFLEGRPDGPIPFVRNREKYVDDLCQCTGEHGI